MAEVGVVALFAGLTTAIAADLYPQPLAAFAPVEAAPIPTAVMAKTARPAAKRAPRFGPRGVPFFDGFMSVL
jgi:hypothetical protein